MDLSCIPVQHCTDDTRDCDRKLSQLQFSRFKLQNIRRHCWAGTSLTDPDCLFNPEATTTTVGNEMGQCLQSAFFLRKGWMSVWKVPQLQLFLTLLKRHCLGNVHWHGPKEQKSAPWWGWLCAIAQAVQGVSDEWSSTELALGSSICFSVSRD